MRHHLQAKSDTPRNGWYCTNVIRPQPLAPLSDGGLTEEARIGLDSIRSNLGIAWVVVVDHMIAAGIRTLPDIVMRDTALRREAGEMNGIP